MRHINVTNSSFARNLRDLIAKHSVTAKEISLATEVPASTISEWLGGRIPRLGEDVLKVARFFNVSLECLISTSTESSNRKEG